ncbi:MAG: flagellar basal-body MS-ring/collar protein FliF [Spirochaetales bacterium]|nr:flagellar basal-body MS-ring/collar protein FliF [Spirochaetales bacterium]
MMNEWFKKIVSSLKEKWSKWTVLKKLLAVGIAVAAVGAVIWLVAGSSKESTIRLFARPVTDDAMLARIEARLAQENVQVYISNDGYISVDNEKIAKKWRAQLSVEGLLPSDFDVYAIFNDPSWNRNDRDDQVKYKKLVETKLQEQLSQLEHIDRAVVTVTLPEEAVYASMQKPATASVTLFTTGNMDLEKNTVKGIQSLIVKAVEGLVPENVVILNSTGNQINDFEGMAESDRLSNIERTQKIRQRLEAKYANDVKAQLETIYPGRVSLGLMTVDWDFSEEKESGTEHTAPVIKQDNKDTSYDDGKVAEEGFPISSETVRKEYVGSLYNPEGPAGVDGLTPPNYSDLSNAIGKTTEEGVKVNRVVDVRNYEKTVTPRPSRISFSVNIDGVWTKDLDSRGNIIFENNRIKRTYTPLSPEQLKAAKETVEGALGSDKDRNDNIVVTNQMVDHSAEFEAEDMAELKRQNRNKAIVLILIGIAVVLVIFILFRIITREIERRRRLREEELLRKQREEREQALWDAKEQGMEVTMSVEERKRAELQESAVAMAKEHPEDVAMLIRTWLMEE